jgi:putative membrane protein
MKTESQTLLSAKFNPRIKTYLLLYIAGILILTIAGIPLLIIWFLGFGQYLSARYYESLECTLTSKHLEFKKGVLFKIEKTIPLENIQDITFIENPLLKYLDLRILKIETAGQSNPQSSDMKLIGVENTLNFKNHILNQRELLKNVSQTSIPQSETNNENIVEILKDIKDILNDIKNK